MELWAVVFRLVSQKNAEDEILQIPPASALFDFLKKLIKTAPSSWLKQ
jgi:hypothetical protein